MTDTKADDKAPTKAQVKADEKAKAEANPTAPSFDPLFDNPNVKVVGPGGETENEAGVNNNADTASFSGRESLPVEEKFLNFGGLSKDARSTIYIPDPTFGDNLDAVLPSGVSRDVAEGKDVEKDEDKSTAKK